MAHGLIILQMNSLYPERWRQTCAALSLSNGDDEHGKLLRAWCSWGRHYHTTGHLAACLQEFDHVRELAKQPAEAEIAIWFHDAVYKTYRKDNEERSAAWAASFLSSHGAPSEVTSRVRELILATTHSTGELAGDAALVVDVDLSILGQPPEIYAEFERNVRREYWWVPRRRYNQARGQILGAFLARPSIYYSPSCMDRWEATARVNLEQAIAILTSQK